MKRQLDQRAGLGDYCEGNIVYKWLLHEGLFDRIRNELGEHIAKIALFRDDLTVVPVNLLPTQTLGYHGGGFPFVFDGNTNTVYVGQQEGFHKDLFDAMEESEVLRANYLNDRDKLANFMFGRMEYAYD
jgi:hypothetical protein